MTIEIDEAIKRYTSNAEYERTHGSLQGCLEFRQLAEWLRDYKRLKEQEPKTEKVIKMRDATPEEQEAIAKYIKSISKPTGMEFDIDIDKKVESYGKLLKHPVIKSIMGMDETQEQLDFVQPHKRIPVTLTVSGDCISRQKAIDTIRQLYIDLATQKYVIDILKALPSVKLQPCEDAISKKVVLDMLEDINAETEGVGFYYEHYVDYIKALPPVKPQESCDVPDTNVGDIISKQTVLDTISELNAISFYEAQEDSKECYYEIIQAIKDLSPVKPQTGHWIEHLEIETSTPEYLMFYECSECGDKQCFCKSDIHKKHFCNNCGARMVEPMLSEIPTDSKDVIWYSKRNYSEIAVEPQERSEE